MMQMSAETALQGRHILVVDDEESIRILVSSGLSQRGAHVTVLGDGADLDQLKPEVLLGIDAVITDVVMPRIGGPALAQRLRSIRPDLPILFMTGFVDALRLGDSLALPKTALVDKPFRLDHLFGQLVDLLG